MKQLKKLKFLGVILVGISMLFLTSCSSTPENIKVIPKDADVVSVVDVLSLAKKGKVHEMQEFNFYKTLSKEIQNDNSQPSKVLQEMLENPLSSGVKLTGDLVMFTKIISRYNYVFASIELSNGKSFGSFIEKVFKDSDKEYVLKKEDNYTYILFNDMFAISWDDDKAVFMVQPIFSDSEKFIAEIGNLYNKSETESITKNEKFNNFYEDRKDISVWISSNLYMDSREFKSFQREFNLDFSDNYSAYFVDFKDGEIAVSTKSYLNKELEQKINELKFTDNKMNADLLKFLPENEYFLASTSINPMAIYNFLSSGGKMQEINKTFKKELGFEIQNIFEELNGNIVFGISDFKKIKYSYKPYYSETEREKEETLPIIGLAFEINGNKIIKELLDKDSKNIFVNKGDYYEFKFDGKVPAYFAFDEKFAFFTNDLTSIKAFKNGGFPSNSLDDSTLAKGIKNNCSFAFLNLNFDEYPEDLQNEVGVNRDSKLKIGVDIWNSIMKDVEFKQKDAFNGEMIIKLNKNENNSLYTIIKTIDDNYNEITSL
ncbi:DUF4836 family protein [Aureivirga marina]|uniref:DUF4836 family protein n=1 Tax=Aureivirga marina TaxID=1182451 RepID=UPI0018C959C0|nr:DUF4836 family protein [Aureivirga marina]